MISRMPEIHAPMFAESECDSVKCVRFPTCKIRFDKTGKEMEYCEFHFTIALIHWLRSHNSGTVSMCFRGPSEQLEYMITKYIEDEE